MSRKKTIPAKRTSTEKADKEVQIIDGKSTEPELESLEEILGHRKPGVFTQSSEDELQEELSEMNLSSLQELAVRAEVFPSGTRLSLKNKLLKKYRSVTTGGESVNIPYSRPILDPNSKEGKDALDFLKKEF